MARSAYIYHFYIEGRWKFSGTVKHEVIWNIYNKGYDKYINARLTVSGDNYEGESEVLGWRPQPKQGEKVVLIDGFIHDIGTVIGINPSGTWSVTLRPEPSGRFFIIWNPGQQRWEEWEKPRKPSKKREAS